MKVAIPCWRERVSPVFDVAGSVLLVEIEGDGEMGRNETALPAMQPFARARRLAELGADTLICGAISRPLEAELRRLGVHVIAHTCGPVEEVLAAYLNNRLSDTAYLMPGCCGRRLRSRRMGRRRGRGVHGEHGG